MQVISARREFDTILTCEYQVNILSNQAISYT